MRASMIRHKSNLERVIFHTFGQEGTTMPNRPMAPFSSRIVYHSRRAALARVLRELRESGKLVRGKEWDRLDYEGRPVYMPPMDRPNYWTYPGLMKVARLIGHGFAGRPVFVLDGAVWIWDHDYQYARKVGDYFEFMQAVRAGLWTFTPQHEVI